MLSRVPAYCLLNECDNSRRRRHYKQRDTVFCRHLCLATHLKYFLHETSTVLSCVESVFTTEDDGDNIIQEFENIVPENKVLNEITFTELDEEDKACGPDGIYPKILKDCAETLAKLLFRIFTEALSSGVVSLYWKFANISPVYKKGSKSMANNHIPVSLTCLASTLVESCVRDAMLRHLLENNLNKTDHHGFTKGRYCLTI